MNKITRLFFLSFLLIPAAEWDGRASGIPEQESGAEIRVLTIQEAVQMTLAQSPEVLITEAQATRAGEAVQESRSLNRPQVVTGTGFAYNNGFPLSVEGAAPSIFQVGLNQPLFSKKNKYLIREAEEGEKAVRFNRESTGNELASRAAFAYFRLYQARKMITLVTDRLAAAENYLEIMESLSRSGKIRTIDISSAKTAVSSARQQLLVAQEEAYIAEMELKNYTGLPAAVTIHTRKPEIQNPIYESDAEALYERILENSPEIQKAEANIRSKEFHLEAEKGERLPELNIVGRYALLSRANNYEDYFSRFSRHNYQVGLHLQIPVFDGFRSSARVAQSRQQVSEAQYQLEKLKSDLKLATQRGLSALRIAKGATEHAQKEVAAVREEITINEVLLQSGRISRKELEETRARCVEKEYAQLEAEQILFQRKLELLQLTGEVSTAF